MIKNNFICPCCGLPNHLEFRSKEDYQSYLENSTEEFWNRENRDFNWFVLEEGEDEENRRLDIQQRFNSIKVVSNKNGDNFNDWFLKQVVGFIKEDEVSQMGKKIIYNSEVYGTDSIENSEIDDLFNTSLEEEEEENNADQVNGDN